MNLGIYTLKGLKNKTKKQKQQQQQKKPVYDFCKKTRRGKALSDQ